MSFPDPISSKGRRRRAVAALLLAAAALASAGCTVRPLYATAPTGAIETPATAALSQIVVEPVQNRQGLEVRNHLIFLLNSGRGQPTTPAYRLRMGVVSQTTSVATRQLTTQDVEPTAGSVSLVASYALIDPATDKPVARGRREISASFDQPPQEFAALRAQRDAEDRAARELAELLRLALAQDLERLAVQ